MEKNATNIIELVDVCKEFDGVSVIDNMNLYVRKGEFVTFLGPSGCGKTTTLRMIAGFEMPTSGKILLNGQDISSLPPNQRPVNTVFQKYALFPHLNVFENVAFGLKLKRVSTTYVDKKGNTVEKYIKLSKAEIAERVKKADVYKRQIVGYDEIIQRKGDGKEKAGNNARQYLRDNDGKKRFSRRRP